MNNEQRLYHHRIYQINQKLEEFKKVCGIEEMLVSFNILNPYNRKFNWLVVNDERWTFENENKYIINNISKCINSYNDEWTELLDELDNKGIADSIKYFRKNVDDKRKWTEEESKDFHFHLLNLYQYYPHEEDVGIDGVVYRNYKNRRKKLLYTKGELLTEERFKDNYRIYPWIDMTFVYESEVKIRSLSSQEQLSGGSQKDIEYTEATFKEEIDKLKKFKITNVSSKYITYFNYIVPLIMGYDHPDPDKKGLRYDGSYVTQEGGKKVSMFLLDDKAIKNLVKKFKYILCFPVYDTFIDKKLYGNLYGNIIMFFAFEEDRDEFLEENQRKIEENLFLLIR
ncbi:MAG: hypothetical protein HON76_05420 [Candidatus Scalindua sp.]|jgi:hypothetical protein|nr:hypothetical protein [Candidatus Scalindua sp.]